MYYRAGITCPEPRGAQSVRARRYFHSNKSLAWTFRDNGLEHALFFCFSFFLSAKKVDGKEAQLLRLFIIRLLSLPAAHLTDLDTLNVFS